MNKKLLVLLVSMVVLDIIDGDFNNMSVLDVVKVVLYIVCFILLIARGKKDGISRET